jgi:TM2 domain-containing membrane protein YozV
MKTTALYIGIVLVLTAGRISPVELKNSPFQKQHQQMLASLYFDEFSSYDLSATSTNSDSDEQGAGGKKSAFRAGLYSALIPGAGEFYLGHKSKARVFFTVEAVSWIGFFAFKTYGGWKKDDFIRFANDRAGADLWNKDDDFVDMVGFYNDIDEYNSLGRAFDPNRAYLEDNASNHWRWQSESDMRIYRHLKNQSREAYRRSDFMIGLAVLNRVISIIDVVRDAKRSRRKIDTSEFSANDKIRYRFEIDPLSHYKQVSFTLYTPF